MHLTINQTLAHLDQFKDRAFYPTILEAIKRAYEYSSFDLGPSNIAHAIYCLEFELPEPNDDPMDLAWTTWEEARYYFNNLESIDLYQGIHSKQYYSELEIWNTHYCSPASYDFKRLFKKVA